MLGSQENIQGIHITDPVHILCYLLHSKQNTLMHNTPNPAATIMDKKSNFHKNLDDFFEIQLTV